MFKGSIKWFNESKGFGFITPDDPTVNGGKDVFLHVTTVKNSGLRDVAEGERFSFDLVDSRGKTAASNLKAID